MNSYTYGILEFNKPQLSDYFHLRTSNKQKRKLTKFKPTAKISIYSYQPTSKDRNADSINKYDIAEDVKWWRRK